MTRAPGMRSVIVRATTRASAVLESVIARSVASPRGRSSSARASSWSQITTSDV